jgi:hypothetical protein
MSSTKTMVIQSIKKRPYHRLSGDMAFLYVIPCRVQNDTILFRQQVLCIFLKGNMTENIEPFPTSEDTDKTPL